MFVWAQRVLHGSEERGPECPLRSGIWGSCLLETVYNVSHSVCMCAQSPVSKSRVKY